MKKSEIRKDYLLEKYVIMAPGRGGRPRQLADCNLDERVDSPFTPDKIGQDRIIDAVGRRDERVISIANIFPAVSRDNRRAYGAHEVIIETPFANRPLADLPLGNFLNAFKLFARRTKALMKDPKISYILCMKNEGVKSGASIRHAHSQIMALELLPPQIAEESRLNAAYRAEHGRDFFDDLISREMASSRRVFSDRHFAAFTPYASAYHYEIWIVARRRVDNISRLNGAELASLAALLKKVLGKIDRLGLSYNFFCHQSVSDPHQRFCLKIQPRDSVWGGLELGSGIVVNSVLPETAARYYRGK